MFTARYECNALHPDWWRDVNKCGGQVFEQVIHLYDLAIHLMGKPKTVSGFIANLEHKDVPGYTVEDTSISAIQFESGALGGISGSNCAVPNEWNATFRVVCDNVIADFTDHNNAVFTYTDGEKRVENVSFDLNHARLENQYFIDTVRGNKPPFATIPEGFTGLKTVAGVVESSKNGGMPVII